MNFTRHSALVPLSDILPQRRLAEIPPAPTNGLARELWAIGLSALREGIVMVPGESFADYERRCQLGIPPHDINNPGFLPKCGPKGAQDL